MSIYTQLVSFFSQIFPSNNIREVLSSLDFHITTIPRESGNPSSLGMSTALSIVNQAVRVITKNNRKNIELTFKTDKITPNEVSLNLMYKVTVHLVSSGYYHFYRGMLDETGLAALTIFNYVMKQLLNMKAVTQEEFDKDIRRIKVNVAMAG